MGPELLTEELRFALGNSVLGQLGNAQLFHVRQLPVFGRIKKNHTFFICADLHINSLHIKQLLQRVGGLMNAAVSSILTQFASSIFQ